MRQITTRANNIFNIITNFCHIYKILFILLVFVMNHKNAFQRMRTACFTVRLWFWESASCVGVCVPLVLSHTSCLTPSHDPVAHPLSHSPSHPKITSPVTHPPLPSWMLGYTSLPSCMLGYTPPTKLHAGKHLCGQTRPWKHYLITFPQLRLRVVIMKYNQCFWIRICNEGNIRRYLNFNLHACDMERWLFPNKDGIFSKILRSITTS